MALRQDRYVLRLAALALPLLALTGGATAEESPLVAPGASAYQAGKTEQAIKALSDVLTDKSATGTDLARAYYFRGLAYGKAGKPAQAIADLNNALWLKGLSAEERASAYLARGKAYQAAGLEARAAQDFRDAEKLQPGAAAQELAAAGAPAAEVPAAVDPQNIQAVVEPAPTGSTALVLTPSTVQMTAKSKSKSTTSTATVGGTTTETGAAQTTQTLRERGGTVSRTSSSEALSTATVPPGNGSFSSIFSGGGDFFSNLFSTSATDEPAATESTSAPATETAVPKRKATLARGENADFSSGGTQAASTENAVAVAATTPAATATEAPLVLGTASDGKDASGAQEASFAADIPEVQPEVSSWSSTIADVQATSFAATEAPPSSGDGGLGNVGTSIGSFFEGLFASNAPKDATGTASSSTVPTATSETKVATLAPAPEPAFDTAVQQIPTGRYKAQIATVRTAEEAQIIARRLQTEREALLGELRADVEPVVLGNMGTFYAVTVGPFRDEHSSERFCSKLQTEGLDCFVPEP
jgi:hypothetical protein